MNHICNLQFACATKNSSHKDEKNARNRTEATMLQLREVRGRRQKHLYNLHFHFSAAASVSHANERANSCSIRIHKILFELRANISRSRAASRHTRKLPHATWHNDSHCPPVCLSFAHSINSSRELQGAPLRGALISRQQLNIYIEIVSSTFLRTEFLIAHFCHKFLMREGERWESIHRLHLRIHPARLFGQRQRQWQRQLQLKSAILSHHILWQGLNDGVRLIVVRSEQFPILGVHDTLQLRILWLHWPRRRRLRCSSASSSQRGGGHCLVVSLTGFFSITHSTRLLVYLLMLLLFFYYYFYTRLQCISVYLVRHFA